MMTLSTTNNEQVPIDFSKSVHTAAGQFLFVKPVEEAQPWQPDTRSFPAVVHNLDEAKAWIKQTPLSDFPELLIIDIPLNMEDLIAFKFWLSSNFIPSIPIIYNETSLKRSEIIRLFQLELIDDVINDDTDNVLLAEKVRFFKSLTVQSLIQPSSGILAVKTPKHTARDFIKRTIDIFVSIAALLVLSPLLLLIAVLIKLTSKGSVLYISERAGKGFNVFNFYKFRTMITGAEEMVDSLQGKNIYTDANGSPAFFKLTNDPRTTKVGVLLRNLSLDELPQLINVLKGDMSLVGNRPLPLREAASLTTRNHAERFMAPAGITGLWQISKRGKPQMSAEERIALDITYARKRSTKEDLRILLNTPLALIQKQSQ